jgi:hypothetical protein
VVCRARASIHPARGAARLVLGLEVAVSIGARVRLSVRGLAHILPEIIKGRLKHGLRRRSCHNRKLTDMSVGVVVRYARCGLPVVKWECMSTEMTVNAAFIETVQ